MESVRVDDLFVCSKEQAQESPTFREPEYKIESPSSKSPKEKEVEISKQVSFQPQPIERPSVEDRKSLLRNRTRLSKPEYSKVYVPAISPYDGYHKEP